MSHISRGLVLFFMTIMFVYGAPKTSISLGSCQNELKNPLIDINQIWKLNGNGYSSNYIELVNLSGASLNVSSFEICYADSGNAGNSACISLMDALVNTSLVDTIKDVYPDGVIPNETFFVFTEDMFRGLDSNLQFAQVNGELLVRDTNSGETIHYLRYWNSNTEPNDDYYFWSRAGIDNCITNIKQNNSSNSGSCAIPDGSFGDHGVLAGNYYVELDNNCTDDNNCWMGAYEQVSKSTDCLDTRGTWNIPPSECQYLFSNAVSSVNSGSIWIDGKVSNSGDRVFDTLLLKGNNLNTGCDNFICSKSNIEPSLLNLKPNSSTENFPKLSEQNNASFSFTAGEYYYNNFTLNGGKTITVSGDVRIYVKGNLTLSGSLNLNGNPQNLVFIYTGNSDIHLNSSAIMYGYFYAPNSKILIDSYIKGGVTAKEIVINSSGNIEYSRSGLDGIVGLCITSSDTSPTIEANSTIIDEGGTKVLSGIDLNTSDKESVSSSIIYKITKLPLDTNISINGTILTISNIATLTFTQADIDLGLLSLIHNGDEESSDSFDFNVSDGNFTISSQFLITVNPINDEPILTIKTISVDENATVVITSSDINGSDVDNSPSELIYTLSTLPSNGLLTLNDINLSLNDTFTQADIDSGKFKYSHDGSETPLSDKFDFSLSDGNATILNNRLNITIVPVNDPPIVEVSDIFLSVNEEIVLINSTLSAIDNDSRGSELVYSLTTLPTNGFIKLNNITLHIGSSFTQEDIDNARVSFKNNGSTDKSGFNFNLTDGVNTISSSLNIIINNPPVIVVSELSLEQNARVTISDLNLSSIDAEQNSSQLTYSITTFPTKGNVLFDGVTLTSPTQTFTQQDIIDGKLEYMHSYSNDDNDSFEFSVSDGFTSTDGTMSIEIIAVIAGWIGGEEDFYLEYTTNIFGDISLIGNSVLCPKSGGSCITNSTKNNNDLNTYYIDIDSDSNTFNSSSADLVIPTGAEVKFAILHWQGRSNSLKGCLKYNKYGSCQSWGYKPEVSQIKFKTPTTSGYTDLNALEGGRCFNVSNSYECYKRVTDLVSEAGTYQVANIFTDENGKNLYGAWALSVVYEESSKSLKNISVYTGYKNIQNSGSYKSADIPINGFLTPYTGDVNSRVFVFAGEGDLGYKNDRLQMTDKNGNIQNVDPSNTNNIFDSSINTNTPRNPFLINNMGIDIDTFSVGTTGSNIIRNGQTSTIVRVATSGDQYYPGMIAFATELYSPKVCYIENIYKNGILLDGNTSVFLGDLLNFEINISNVGTEDAAKVQVSKTFEAPISYSKTFGTYINGVLKTNISADDEVDYLDSSYRLDVRIGSGASATDGGLISLAQQEQYLYNANIIAYPPNGEINNIYRANYISETLKILFNTVIPKCQDDSSVYPKIYVSQFTIKTDVQPKDSEGNITLGFDEEFTYDVNITNNAPFDEENPAIAINFKNGFMVNSFISSDVWSCSPVSPNAIVDELICQMVGAIKKDGNNSTIKFNMKAPSYSLEVNSSVVAKSTLDTRTLGVSEAELIKVSNLEANLSIVSIDINSLGNSIEIADSSEELIWTIDINNSGKDIARDVNITIPLSGGYIFNNSSNGWSCVLASDNNLSCVIDELNVSLHTLELNITSVPSIDLMVDLNNTASISSAIRDGDSSDNSKEFNIKYYKETKLDITTHLDDITYLDFNQSFEYNLTISNSGNSTALGVEFNLSLDSIGSFLDITKKSGVIDIIYDIGDSNWSCRVVNEILNCVDGNLTSGSDMNVSIPFISPKNISGEFNSSIYGYSSNAPMSDEDNTSLRVGYSDLSIDKITLTSDENQTGGDSIYVKGYEQNITMVLDINNSGPSSAKDITVTIPLDENFTLVNFPSDWSCDKLIDSIYVTCTIESMPIGEYKLELNITTPTGYTPDISADANISSPISIDDDLDDNKKHFNIGVLDMADLSVSNFEITAIHNSTQSSVKSINGDEEIISDFGTTLIFAIDINNSGPDTASSVYIDLLISSDFESGSAIGINDLASIGFDSSKCNIVDGHLICPLGDLNKFVLPKRVEFTLTSPDVFNDYSSMFTIYSLDKNSSSGTYDPDITNNTTEFIRVKNLFSESKINPESETNQVIQGSMYLLSDINSTFSISGTQSIQSVKLLFQGYIPNAESNKSFMLSSSESNITQIKLNGVTYTDSNISWITVPNSNEYGYDIIYKGSINLDVSALKSGTNTLSNLTGASNLSDWAIAVVYKDTSFNYLNVINTREYLRIFDINDTPSSPQDAVVSMFDSSMDFLGFQTPSELNETGSKIATLNISESSNTLFTPQIEGNDKSVPYLGEESVSNEVGVDKKSALIRFSNEQKRYYSSFLGLITKVKSPLCYYAHNNKGSKNNQKSYDIALGDRVLITFDTDIDTSNFSGSENATNTFVSLETSSNFKFDFIGNSGLLAEDGDVKTISIGSVVNQGNGDAFRYRLTLISEPSGVIDSVLPQSVKASFDFGSFGRFENITIKECQNDKFVYQDIERIFDIFGEFNGFGSNGDVDGDSNITTQSLDDNKTLTLSPLNLETFDNNRSYKLTITLVDIQNGGATIKTVPLPNSGIFDSEHNTTEFDIASLDLDSVYRHLAFNIEWVLVDENGVEIDVLDSNGSSTKVSGTTQSDGFSIKPDRFDITVPEGARAGENFTIKIKSLNKDGSDAKNYNEIENTSFTFKTIKNINSLGSIEYKSPIRFTDGNTSDFDMNISEVGSFDINISDGGDSITPSDCSFCNEATINASCLDVSGCPFACVDIKSDSCEGLSLITSDAEDINITPYSFEITNFKISDDWAYMGGYDSGNKVEINATIIAKNFQGATTQNFTSEIFNDINMSLITLNADFNITLNNPSGNSFDLNTSVGTTPNISELAGLFSILTSSTDFINGEQNISLAMNIDRNHFNRLNPIEFLVNDINTTNSGAVIPAENIGIVVNDRFGLYYGRVYAPNIEIDVNDTPFKNAIFTEVYMQDTAYDFDNLISNRIENAQNVNWYQNELDSITIIDEVRAINLSGNLDSFIDLIVDENQVINTLSIVDGNYTISSIGIDSLEISSISHITRFFIKADKHLWFDIASTSDYDGDSNNINRQSYFEVAFRKGDDGPGVNEGIKPNTLNKRRLDW